MSDYSATPRIFSRSTLPSFHKITPRLLIFYIYQLLININIKREGDHTSTPASTGRVQTETNQTEPKKTCKVRNRRERKGTMGHAGVQSATQQHRVLPSSNVHKRQQPVSRFCGNLLRSPAGFIGDGSVLSSNRIAPGLSIKIPSTLFPPTNQPLWRASSVRCVAPGLEKRTPNRLEKGNQVMPAGNGRREQPAEKIAPRSVISTRTPYTRPLRRHS